jgi:hypothetical protein
MTHMRSSIGLVLIAPAKNLHLPFCAGRHTKPVQPLRVTHLSVHSCTLTFSVQIAGASSVASQSRFMNEVYELPP